MRLVGSLLLFGAVAAPVFAVSVPYRASIRGGGGNGKCTIEVEVDNVATVEINGERGVLNSPRSGFANWRRFQCNQVMPRNPANFRFRGIDGRGRQDLLRQPNSNGGTAVIQITDNGGGREGYTFDIEWDGGFDGGGYPPGGGGGYYPPPGGGHGGWGGGNSFTVERASEICEQAVRIEARNRYGVNNPRFERVRFENSLGHNDWIIGNFRSGRGEDYRFLCSVSFNRGQVKDVNIQRGGGIYVIGGGGHYGGGGMGWGGGSNFPPDRAVVMCQEFVRRQARDRYGVNNPNFERVRFDPNAGHNDWIHGYFRAGRGDQYKFYCVVDFNRGTIRDARIERGWY